MVLKASRCESVKLLDENIVKEALRHCPEQWGLGHESQSKTKIAVIDKGGHIRPKTAEEQQSLKRAARCPGECGHCPCKTDSPCPVPRTYPKELGVAVHTCNPACLKRKGRWRRENLPEAPCLAGLEHVARQELEDGPCLNKGRRELPPASCACYGAQGQVRG